MHLITSVCLALCRVQELVNNMFEVAEVEEYYENLFEVAAMPVHNVNRVVKRIGYCHWISGFILIGSLLTILNKSFASLLGGENESTVFALFTHQGQAYL